MKLSKIVQRLLLASSAAFGINQVHAKSTIVQPVIAASMANIDWEQYHGKVVYIDFWASWCGPCKASFPWMNAMQRKYAKQGLVIVAINVDTEPAKAAAFLQQNPAQFTVHYDPSGQLATQFAVKTMPSSYVLGRTGKPLAKHQGFSPSKVASYEAELVQLLAQE